MNTAVNPTLAFSPTIARRWASARGLVGGGTIYGDLCVSSAGVLINAWM